MFGLDKSSVLIGWKGVWHGLQGVTWGLNSLNKWKCLSFKSNICHRSTICVIYANIYSRSYKTSNKKLAFTAFSLQLYPKPIWSLLSPFLCQICNIFTDGKCSLYRLKKPQCIYKWIKIFDEHSGKINTYLGKNILKWLAQFARHGFKCFSHILNFF